MKSNPLRAAWRQLPIDIRTKQRVQVTLFRLFPVLFRRNPAFIEWSEQRVLGENPGVLRLDSLDDEADSVEHLEAPPLTNTPVKLIAFYLPQFHPIPENDAWWGRGFTEWTNVIRGRPRFPGHYQPQMPGELGFYDLRIPAVQHRQIELAKQYGVGGFAFYFYWFAGKRLLESPLLQFLDDPTMELPFCLCWANESWSRRWDGRDQELLITQEHSAEDDIAFIAYISKYLRDSRYIRVDGRPLLIVYRPDLLPAPADTAKRWRTWCKANGIGDLYLAYTQSFESTDPEQYGMDAAIEFPPNNTNPPVITDQIASLDKDFEGIVFDWRVFPTRSRNYQLPAYRLFRGVNPAWDNEARRQGKGAVFYGSSPEGYREWLENAIRDTVTRFAEPSERLVFANAWNEWAEGAHLEPDQRYGYAYLQATRSALQAARFFLRRRFLIVSHDARPHGAQYLALNLARELKNHFGYRVHMVVLEGGALLEEYQKVATVDLLDGVAANGPVARNLAQRLRNEGITDAFVNTTASGGFTAALRGAGIRIISLIHELPELIRNHRLQEPARTIAANADKVVFPARPVLEGFRQFVDIPDEKIVMRPQGLYKRNAKQAPKDQRTARRQLRERLGMDPQTQIVLGVGYGDLRKGLDIFVEAGIATCRKREQIAFVWVGGLDRELERDALLRITEAGLLSRFYFPGHESQTDIFYAGSDIYAMTSREDPFPSVILEALEVGVPVLGFEGAGGFTTLAETGCLKLAPSFDADAFASALCSMLEDANWKREAGETGRALVNREFGFRRYLFDLLGLTSEPPPKITVIVPNFNYCHYLPERLASITAQTVPVYEIIVLDDASIDGSRDWLESELHARVPEAQLVIAEENSGSVFRQWLKGAELARGDYIWIAEADDLAEPSFLQTALSGFSDPEVVLSFTQSKQIDGQGNVLAEHYLDYVADIPGKRWKRGYVADGLAEIRDALAIKNTIPNVSSVLFRRETLVAVLQEQIDALLGYKVAGDWVTYVELLSRGNIAFNAESLNLHRRHDESVTLSRFDLSQLTEILSVQRMVRERFDLKEETISLAAAYAQTLYEQFGLATAQHPTTNKHPALTDYL